MFNIHYNKKPALHLSVPSRSSSCKLVLWFPLKKLYHFLPTNKHTLEKTLRKKRPSSRPKNICIMTTLDLHGAPPQGQKVWEVLRNLKSGSCSRVLAVIWTWEYLHFSFYPCFCFKVMYFDPCCHIHICRAKGHCLFCAGSSLRVRAVRCADTSDEKCPMLCDSFVCRKLVRLSKNLQ